MAEETTAGQAARKEAATQAVALAFGVVMLVIYTWGQRRMGDPDSLRSVRMSAAKRAERFWAKLAAAAWGKAESARLKYERDRA
jgi:hypothetical protein